MAVTTYTATTFVDGTTPGITAAELNKIGNGIADVTTEVIAVESGTAYSAGNIYAYKNNGGAL